MHHLDIAETTFKYKSLADITPRLQNHLERLSIKATALETEQKHVHTQQKAI